MGQTTDEIRRRRQLEANKKGKKIENLNRNERRRVSKKVLKKKKRNKAIKAILAAIGITTLAGLGGRALLPSGNDKENENTITTESTLPSTTHEEFVNKYREDIETEPNMQTQENIDIYQTIVDQYNEQYPDADITAEDLGIICSRPSNQLYRNGEESIILDYDLDEEAYPNAELIGIDSQKVYIVIDKKNEKIPIAMTKIDGNFEQVDVVKYIADTERNPYTSQQIALTEENKENMYQELEEKYNEVVHEAEEEER